jgi:hypothetical protein
MMSMEGPSNRFAGDLSQTIESKAKMAQSALLADRLPREPRFKHSLQLYLALRQYGTQEQEDQMLNLP